MVDQVYWQVVCLLEMCFVQYVGGFVCQLLVFWQQKQCMVGYLQGVVGIMGGEQDGVCLVVGEVVDQL